MRGYKDLILPFAVVIVVGIMIFPLPVAILDILLMCNVAFALCLLISSVYLSEPARFTSLPTILLLSTLFRLGLNVSTTRQLLGQGVAPEIVNAFGNFVVSGNFVVGFVIFSIVTLVQFIVIAKGAERIAEVAARFTLDAMPGKQMSIDADIRAGILSLEEAREKRRELHRESRLYGALDGAMKFVKGDAIAGIIITIINITAGLFVGISQQGLSLADAARKYTIFTIGDGLVSQIPALLVGVAAGIVVTRVQDKDDVLLGQEIFAQLGREPQTLATTGSVLFALSLVPGFPFVPFMVSALGFFFFAYQGLAQKKVLKVRQLEHEFRPKLCSSLVLRISSPSILRLSQEGSITRLVQQLRTKIFDTRGVIVPDFYFDHDLAAKLHTATLLLHGAPLGQWFYSEEELQKYTLSEHLIEQCEKALTAHLAELVDDTQTRTLFELHQSYCEDLINSVVPNMISTTGLTAILKQLVLEQVSIREMRLILQAIADDHLLRDGGAVMPTLLLAKRQNLVPELKALSEVSVSTPTRLQELLAEVRQALGAVISRGVADRDGQIRAMVLSAELDHLMVRAALSGGDLAPQLVEQITQTLKEKEKEENGEKLVVISSKYARSMLAELIRLECPAIAVLSVNEVSAEIEIIIRGSLIVMPSAENGLGRANKEQEETLDTVSWPREEQAGSRNEANFFLQ